MVRKLEGPRRGTCAGKLDFEFIISDVSSGCRDPNHQPFCRPLYAIGLDACLYRDKLKQNEAYLTSSLQCG
jgi:hypothetical protein